MITFFPKLYSELKALEMHFAQSWMGICYCRTFQTAFLQRCEGGQPRGSLGLINSLECV